VDAYSGTAFYAEDIFEWANLRGEGRLRPAQLFGGFPQAACLRHGSKVPQV